MDQNELNPQQMLDDRNYVRNIVQNNLQVVDQAAPERRAEMELILERQEEMDRLERRGGPTRHDLLDLSQFCPGEQGVVNTANKGVIVVNLLRRV